jgi:hypothetical protein
VTPKGSRVFGETMGVAWDQQVGGAGR